MDIYGCLSEFIGTAVSDDVVTLLDINNSVPDDMYEESIRGKFDYTHKDTFMGFHCGNTLPFINGGEGVHWVPEVPTWLSLAVIVLAIGGASVASVIKMKSMESAEKA